MQEREWSIPLFFLLYFFRSLLFFWLFPFFFLLYIRFFCFFGKPFRWKIRDNIFRRLPCDIKQHFSIVWKAPFTRRWFLPAWLFFFPMAFVLPENGRKELLYSFYPWVWFPRPLFPPCPLLPCMAEEDWLLIVYWDYPLIPTINGG